MTEARPDRDWGETREGKDGITVADNNRIVIGSVEYGTTGSPCMTQSWDRLPGCPLPETKNLKDFCSVTGVPWSYL